MKFKVLARHKWLTGVTISESINTESGERRFTATIRGWRNWKIWQGQTDDNDKTVKFVIDKVRTIRDRIDSGDESIFNEENEYNLHF